jgi:hypothetical protein
VLGDIGHRRARALLAVLAQGGLPGVAIEGDATDGGMMPALLRAITAKPTLRDRACHTKPVQPAESVRTWTGRRADLDRSTHEAGVVTESVADGDLGG